MANRDSNPDKMNAFKRQSSRVSLSSNQETVPTSSRHDDGFYKLEYMTLVHSLNKMVAKYTNDKIIIKNVQIGQGNIIFNEDTNDTIIKALNDILTEQQEIKRRMREDNMNVIKEHAKTKFLLAEMKEQMQNALRMLKNISETGDQTAETMSKLADLIQAMSKEETDFLTDTMSSLVAEIKEKQGDSLSENGQKAFSYILQSCGEGDDRQVWEDLARELGVEVTVYSNPKDTCMKILLDWLQANEDKDSGQLGNTLLSALQKDESKRDDDNIPEETRQLSDVTQKFRTIEAHAVLIVQRVTEMQRQLQQLLDTNQSVITTHM